MNFVCYAVLGGARVVVSERQTWMSRIEEEIGVIFDEKDG